MILTMAMTTITIVLTEEIMIVILILLISSFSITVFFFFFPFFGIFASLLSIGPNPYGPVKDRAMHQQVRY